MFSRRIQTANEAAMSSVQHLRDVISQRLTAAAEEIFGVFEKNIVEYEEEVARQSKLRDIIWEPGVKLQRIELPQFIGERLTAAAEEIFRVCEKNIFKYEEALARQNELLDIVWKPEINLDRIELPQQPVCKEEEVLTDQQLCDQERNSSMDQEEPEPLQIKEEQEETCTSQEGEQLVLKQETDAFMLTPGCEEGDHREPEPDWDHQLLSHNTLVAESQDQEGSEHVASGSNPQKSLHENWGDGNNVYNSPPSNVHSDIQMEEKSFKCDICGKGLKYKYGLKRHMRTHTGEKPYLSKTESNPQKSPDENRSHSNNVYNSPTCIIDSNTHIEKKSLKCDICGKVFKFPSDLKRHMTVHTGEKPYMCILCGKCFAQTGDLRVHIRIHTCERPYSCTTCGKRFSALAKVRKHSRIHTGERPYPCNMCDKSFLQKCNLISHIRTHTGEKPHSCQMCGKRFSTMYKRKMHERVHKG